MDIETKNTNAVDAASMADDKKTETRQWEGLRRVPDKLPKLALLILAVEACITCLVDE